MYVNIVWIYKSPKKRETELTTTESMPVHQALFFAEDFEKTGRVKDIYFVDEMNNTWTQKELKKYVKGIETEPHDIEAFFDGGYDIESKRAGLGAVIYFTQNGKKYRIRKNEQFSELSSNNEAEYAALWMVLREVEELGAHHLPVTIKGDSQVVIQQVTGEWAVYEEEFNKWLDRIEAKVKSLGLRPTYEGITRKENREADQLATQALTDTPIFSRTKINGDVEA